MTKFYIVSKLGPMQSRFKLRVVIVKLRSSICQVLKQNQHDLVTMKGFVAFRLGKEEVIGRLLLETMDLKFD